LLNGLEHYSRVVEILCNGTPFLAWIWAPITLILRVASEYVEAFEQIMRGYSKVCRRNGLRRAYATGCGLASDPRSWENISLARGWLQLWGTNTRQILCRSVMVALGGGMGGMAQLG
jgi:hypothetical protein